jgi:hypothetical protein
MHLTVGLPWSGDTHRRSFASLHVSKLLLTGYKAIDTQGVGHHTKDADGIAADLLRIAEKLGIARRIIDSHLGVIADSTDNGIAWTNAILQHAGGADRPERCALARSHMQKRFTKGYRGRRNQKALKRGFNSRL